MHNKLNERMNQLSEWLLGLHRTRNENGEGAGWPAVEISDPDGVLTTASAVRVLVDYEKVEITTLKIAISFIINAQGRNGGWALISGADNPSTISTAEALQALAAAYVVVKEANEIDFGNKIKKAIKSSIQWLLNIQNDDGGWSSVVSEDRSVSSDSNTYATSIVLIALDYCCERVSDIREFTSEYDDSKKNALLYLDTCRAENQLWKVDQNQKQTDIVISTVVAYVYCIYNKDDIDSIIDLFNRKFVGYENISLPVGKISIQFPFGDVQFYVNGAFWICKLFARFNKPYIGYIKYIKYMLEKSENQYYLLKDLASNYVHGQSTWVSIDTLELGRMLLALSEEIILKSVIHAAAYIARIDEGKIDNEYQFIITTMVKSQFDIEKLVEQLVIYTQNPKDVIFCETFIKCLASINYVDDDKATVVAYEEALIEKLKTIDTYEEYSHFSEERRDYNGFSVLKHIRALTRVLNIIYALANRLDNSAIDHFILIESGSEQLLSRNISYDLFKLVSLITSNSGDIELINNQIQTTKERIKDLFSPNLLETLFNQLQLTTMGTEGMQNDDIYIDEAFAPIEKLVNTGTPVPVTETLFGREEILREACKQISNGTSIAITGDFRIGKTSFITHIEHILRTEFQYLTCYIDFTIPLSYEIGENNQEIISFFKLLTENLRKTLDSSGRSASRLETVKKGLQSFYDSIDSFSLIGVAIDKKSSSNVMSLYKDIQDLIQSINNNYLEPENKYLVIIVDEFASASNSDQTSVIISRICRTIIQNATRIRLVIASQNILLSKDQHEKVPLTTVLTIFQLKGYDVNLIKQFIIEKDDRLNIKEDAVYELKRITGGNPYWLGLIFNCIIEIVNNKKSYTITKEIVFEAVATFLHSQDGMSKLQWFYDVTVEKSSLYEEILLILSPPSVETMSIKRIRTKLKEKFTGITRAEISDGINTMIRKSVIAEHSSTIDSSDQELSIVNGLLKCWIYNNYGGIE